MSDISELARIGLGQYLPTQEPAPGQMYLGMATPRAMPGPPKPPKSLFQPVLFGENGEWFSDDEMAFGELPRAPTTTTIGAFINHPELFRRFPQARNIPLSFEHIPGRARIDGGEMHTNFGSYNPETGGITINLNQPAFVDRNQLGATLIHEMQHALQDMTGRSGIHGSEEEAGGAADPRSYLNLPYEAEAFTAAGRWRPRPLP